MHEQSTIFLATRGSALALAQADRALTQCREAFPDLPFDIKVIRTTGDKFETASLAQGGGNLPVGLFTKELEVALLNGQADLAVHSLKDLPVSLPVGLKLGAVGQRADVRDVLIRRGPRLSLNELPAGAVIGTSSTRRRAQLKALRPDLVVVEIRGNIISRLQRLACRWDLEAIVLAAAGLERLDLRIAADGRLIGALVPNGLSATLLDVEVMLPCIGQGALGIEVRQHDDRIASICERLNHLDTEQCVTAERSFLAAMGGGCASPVAAYAEIAVDRVQMRAMSFPDGIIRHTAGSCERARSAELGWQLAAALKRLESPKHSDPTDAADRPSRYGSREVSTRI